MFEIKSFSWFLILFWYLSNCIFVELLRVELRSGQGHINAFYMFSCILIFEITAVSNQPVLSLCTYNLFLRTLQKRYSAFSMLLDRSQQSRGTEEHSLFNTLIKQQGRSFLRLLFFGKIFNKRSVQLSTCLYI